MNEGIQEVQMGSTEEMDGQTEEQMNERINECTKHQRNKTVNMHIFMMYF